MQFEHSAAPAAEEYRPEAHTVQTDVPVISALYAPATHALHTADVDAVALLPYVPATHAVHAAEVDDAATLP